MNTQSTLTKAPGVFTNEIDLSSYENRPPTRSPVCLMFGFAPKGAILESKYMRSVTEIQSEFGLPETSLEKYFYNAGVRTVLGGGTALMVRLPYDNAQANSIKYVRYAVGNPIHRKFVYEKGEQTESWYRKLDNEGIDTLNRMHELDSNMNGYSRITLASKTIESMPLDKFEDVCLDASELEDDSIYIFDVKKQQLGTNPVITEPKTQYIGVVPVIVTTTTALYVQEKIENNSENDKLFNLLSMKVERNSDGTISRIDPSGIVVDGDWNDPPEETDPNAEDDPELQQTLRDVLESFSQDLDFNHSGTFYDKKSVGDVAALQYPMVRFNTSNHLESKYFDQIGIVVMEMVYNEGTDKVDFIAREAFCGYVSNTDSQHTPLELDVNANSKYIRIIRKVRRSSYRDFFHISNQPLVVFGMKNTEVLKKINYQKSIYEPISYMLDAWLSDIDGTSIDLILDAGITTVAHYAWKKYLDPEYGKDASFYFNPQLDNVFVPSSSKATTADSYMATLKELEYCSTAWNRMVRLFTSFIETKRGDCLFIADGPRCLNLDRSIPLLQRYPSLTTTSILNRYLKYFTDQSTSYGMRIFNWVLATDHSTQLTMWMPPSVVAVQLFARSDNYKFPWYAAAGVERGLATACSAISLRTKPYSSDNDFLYSNQWNFFTQNINTGIILEGNKTMQMEHTALDRVNVRRLCNYIKRQIRNISNRYKYEPNTAGLRMQYAEELGGLLDFIQKNAGIESYMVACNDRNNPNEVVERNELRATIAIKPIKAIEYIIVDLCVTRDGITFTEGVR